MIPETSTTTTTEPVSGNVLSRLMGVYFSPGETFKSIGLAPKFVVPLILLVVLSAAATWVFADRIGAVKIASQAIEKKVTDGKITQEEANQQIEPMKKREPIIKATFPIFGALGALIAVLVLSGIYKLATMAMGAENTFSQMLGVTVYTYLAVSIISTIVFIAILYLKSPDEIDIQNPIGSNLGALLTMMMGADRLPKFVTIFANWIDVFSIWKIALLSIGYSVVSRRLKLGSAAMLVTALYLVGAVIAAAWGSLF